MSERHGSSADIRSEFKASLYYFLVYLPVLLSIMALLCVGLPFVVLGIEPSFVLQGWHKLWAFFWVLACLAVAVAIAAVAWLHAAKQFVTLALAKKVLMPFGMDPVTSWQVDRFFRHLDRHSA